MIVLQNILSQEIVQRLGWTLLHFVWQAAAAALLLAILLRVLRKSTANLRYIIACFTLGLIVILPVITIQLVPASASYSSAHIELPTVSTVLPTETTEASMAETPLLEKPFQPESIPTAPVVSWKEHTAELLEPALPYIVLGWLVGVFGLSIWHLGGWAQLQRLRRKMVKQVDDTLHSKLSRLAERLAVNRAVQLMESALVQVPTIVGWLRPVILLPASALSGLNANQLEALLAHELAHIKRFDYLVNILQTVVEILGFYHPAVWWVSHKIRVERENCCDDLAVSISVDRVCYARALTSMEEIRAGQGQLAVAAAGGNLLRRIRRLLGKDSVRKTSFSWIPAATTILLIIALAIPTTLALTTKSNTIHADPNTVMLVDGEAPWGESVNGLRMRVTAPAGTEYVRLQTLPLVIEIQNISDEGFPIHRLPVRVRAEATDEAGKKLDLIEPVTISPWDGRSDYLPAGAVVSWTCWFERFQFVSPPQDGSQIELCFILPTRDQRSEPNDGTAALFFVKSNSIQITLKDIPPVPLSAGDLPEQWAPFMDFTYRRQGRPGVYRGMHIDRDGYTTIVGRNSGLPSSRMEVVLDHKHLEKLTKLLRTYKVWELAKVKSRIASPDEPEIFLSLNSAGTSLSCRFPESIAKKLPTLVALQKEIQALITTATTIWEETQKGWGEETEGIQCRLRADKVICKYGEIPTFKADVRNSGMHELFVAQAQELCEIEFDGQWYRWNGEVDVKSSAFGPGRRYNDIVITLIDNWRSKSTYNSLNLDACKHTIRVAFFASPPGIGNVPKIQTISNPVEIEILPREKTSDVQIEVKSAESPPRLGLTEIEQRSESLKKLRSLGLMLTMYTNDHDGKYPYSLQETEPYDTDRVLAWSLENARYLGAGKNATISPQAVIAYDKTILEKGNGTNVLFNDAHVEFCKPDKLEALGIKSEAILRVQSAEKLKQLALAVIMYADDHNEKLPDTLQALKPYIADEQDFQWVINNIEYLGKGKNLYWHRPWSTPVAYDKMLLDKTSGTNVTFLDGHVEYVQADRLEKLGISKPKEESGNDRQTIKQQEMLKMRQDYINDDPVVKILSEFAVKAETELIAIRQKLADPHPEVQQKAEYLQVLKKRLDERITAAGKSFDDQQTAKRQEMLKMRQDYINDDPVVKILSEFAVKAETELIAIRQKLADPHPEVQQKAEYLQVLKKRLDERITTVGKSFDDMMTKENSNASEEKLAILRDELRQTKEYEQQLSKLLAMEDLELLKITKRMESAENSKELGVAVIMDAEELTYPKNWWEIIQRRTTQPDKPIGLDPADVAIYKQLETIIVDLSELTPTTSLSDAIEVIRNSVEPQLKIVVLWRDLLDNADIEPGTEINMDGLPAVRLAKGLESLLKAVSGQFAELGYVVQHGVITIGTLENLPSKLETRVYDISDLVKTTADTNDLIHRITDTIEPDSWYELSETGEGTITPYPRQQPKKLAIRQTRKIHQKIESLLEDIRSSQAKPAIQIEVRLLSAREEFLKDIGLDPNSIHDANAWSELTPGVLPASDDPNIHGLILSDFNVSFLLKAAQAQKGAKMLVAPRPTVLDGKRADLKVMKGLMLQLTPKISFDGKYILLNIDFELSELIGFETRRYKDKYPYEIPEMDTVNFTTRLIVPDGGTLLIGGQKITEEVKRQSGVPILSKIPVIGGLFRSSAKVKEQRTLLILIKPTILPQEQAEAIGAEKVDSEEPTESLARQLESRLKRAAEPR